MTQLQMQKYQHRYQKEYRKNNRQKIKVLKQRHYAENKEVYNARTKLWAEENQEFLKDYRKRYYAKNAETIKASARERYRLNKMLADIA